MKKKFKFGIVTLILITGFVISFLSFFIIDRQDSERISIIFNAQCDETIKLFQNIDKASISDLNWLKKIFRYNDNVSFREFSRCIVTTFETNSFRSVYWITNQNNEAFQITFMETIDSQDLTGTDLYKDLDERTAMENARDSNQIITSQLKNITKEKESFYQTTIYLPVYQFEPVLELDQKRRLLKGFVAGTIRLDSVFNSFLETTKSQGLITKIYDKQQIDPKNPDKFQLIYSDGQNQDNITLKQNNLHDQFSFFIANREFLVEILPSNLFFDVNKRHYQWNILLFSLIITLLLTVFISNILYQKEVANNLVVIKTKELNESKEKYQTILRSIGDGVISVDKDCCVTSINQVAMELTGWSESEVIRKPFIDVFTLIDTHTGAKSDNPLLQSIKTGKVVHLIDDTTLINRYNKHIQIADSAAPIMNNLGQLNGAVIVFRDISMEYNMKKALLESENKFKAIAMNAIDAILLIDENSEIVFWNSSAERIFGYLPQEMLLKNFQSLLSSDDFFNQTFQGIKVYNESQESQLHDLHEINGRHKYGHVFPIETTVSAVMIKDKYHIIAIIRDISERKRAEEEIKKQNNLLNELMIKKDEFLSIAAHDIRNPLTVITGYTDLLLVYSKNTLTKDQMEMIKKINDSAKFIIQLLNDLLDYSSLESGNVRLDKQNGDFEKFLTTYIQNNAIVAHQKNIEISLTIQKNLPFIDFDVLKIQQVLNNLTSNAIKFSHPGTTINIEVKIENGFLCTSVKDNGQGIPDKEISHLFKPFQKTSVKSTRGEKSTGLGLVIARNIIRAHKGDITVDSTFGQGSTFTFSLPI